MSETAVFAVDVHAGAEMTDSEVESVNKTVEKAQQNDERMFYVLPEGEALDSRVIEKTVSSIIRYNPEKEDPYKQARVDSQVTHREITQTQFVGAGKLQKFSDEEEKRGRPSFAGPPDNKGGNGNGNENQKT